MNRRLLSIVFLSFVACTFPDPEISNDASTGTDSGSTTDSGKDTVSEDSTDDTLPEDTTPEPDTFEEIGPDADPCDQDGDGFQNGAVGCASGKLDCNDFTRLANPDQKDFVHLDPADAAIATHWVGAAPGDWDCSGITEKEFTVQESCAKGTTLNCAPSNGIDRDPNTTPCGTGLNEVTCIPAGGGALNCKAGTLTAAIMGCR